MPLIPLNSIPHFENAIYLPMVLTILTRDRAIVEASSVKLKRPYVHLIDFALKEVQNDLKESNRFLRERKMKILKGMQDDTFTEYVFFVDNYKENRRYLNLRLRNGVEERIEAYFARTYQNSQTS